MARVFALGKINRALFKFDKIKKLKSLDKRLLKGFYINNKAELDSNDEIKFSKKDEVERHLKNQKTFKKGKANKHLLELNHVDPDEIKKRIRGEKRGSEFI